MQRPMHTYTLLLSPINKYLVSILVEHSLKTGLSIWPPLQKRAVSSSCQGTVQIIKVTIRGFLQSHPACISSPSSYCSLPSAKPPLCQLTPSVQGPSPFPSPPIHISPILPDLAQIFPVRQSFPMVPPWRGPITCKCPVHLLTQELPHTSSFLQERKRLILNVVRGSCT